MMSHLKKISLLMILLISCSLRATEDQDLDNKFERYTYPNMSKVLFKAYLNNDTLKVKDIIEDKKFSGHKLYLLERAFFYGAEKYKEKELSYMKEFKYRNAMWRIAQDFSQENRSERWAPTAFWTGVSALSFLAGGYAQKKHKTWDNFKHWFGRVTKKDCPKNSGNKGKRGKK